MTSIFGTSHAKRQRSRIVACTFRFADDACWLADLAGERDQRDRI
jgi:hypothetical protein